MTADRDWAALVTGELVQEAARRLNCDTKVIRPCFARIAGVAKGSRNNTGFILACELRRMGVDERAAWHHLSTWNDTNRPPLGDREVQATFESAWRSEKVYGCRGALAQWCTGRDSCSWYADFAERRKRPVEDAVSEFVDKGWLAVLSSAQVRTYLALLRLERLRALGAGATLAVSTRDIAEMGGLYRKAVPKAWQELEARGLLVIVQSGQKRQAGLPSRAALVLRVVPMPEPAVGAVNARRQRLCA